MSDDIKLPEPAFRLTWDDSRAGYYVSKPNVGDTDVFTADQLRAAVLADRAERASAADLELPSLAIREGRRCVDRLDGYYDFECEGGPLRMNVEWDILKRSFEHLCRHIERARGIVDQDSKPK